MASKGCIEKLAVVRHVTHIARAVKILQAGCIYPSQIEHHGKKWEFCPEVVWMSPYDWAMNPAIPDALHNGYRYGSIAFTFDFLTMWNIFGGHASLVDIMDYKPIAPRILVSNDINEPSDENILEYFSFCEDSKAWVWDTSFCLEFMMQTKVHLKHAIRIEYVPHNTGFCSEGPVSTCPETAGKYELQKEKFGYRPIPAGVVDSRLCRELRKLPQETIKSFHALSDNVEIVGFPKLEAFLKPS